VRLAWLGLFVLIASSTPALADVTRCSGATANVAFDAGDLGALSNLSGDTGWFPDDSPVQIRLAGQVDGSTHVGMQLQPVACWAPDGTMTLTVQPARGTGSLTSQYGTAVQLYARIHTTVLWETVDWEGQIPVPYIGDLLLAGQTAFDPIALPDSPTTYAQVSDATNPITVLSSNELSAIIDVTGISGGLALEVEGQMSTTYWTNDVSVVGSQLTSASGTAPVAGPFGAQLPTRLAVDGTVEYSPALDFILAFQVRILGISVVNLQLANIVLPLPSFDRDVQLTTEGDVAVPLPQLGNVPATLGFGSAASATLHLSNSGAAPLMVEQVAGPAFAPLTIAPGAAADVVVPASTAPDLVLATNDPTNPQLTIALSASSSGQIDQPPADGAGDDSHAGCSAGGSSTPVMVLLVVAFVIARSRLRCLR
jgi:hypothetical protein